MKVIGCWYGYYSASKVVMPVRAKSGVGEPSMQQSTHSHVSPLFSKCIIL